MDDRIKLAAGEPAEELARRDHIGELALAQVAPLALRAERIIDRDISPPGLVEAGDQIGPDEPGPAGDQQHPVPATPAALPLCPSATSGATWTAGALDSAGR